jgi:hypothetical protein
MNASSHDTLPNPASNTRATPRDLSFPVVASLFGFLGIGGLLNREWIDAAGWLAMTLGLCVLVASRPMTDQNWKQPRYLVCLALFVAGITLVLAAPGHRREGTRLPLSHPGALATPIKPNP